MFHRLKDSIRLGSPKVQAGLSWNQLQYVLAYYIITFAKLGFQLCSSFLTVGGTIQNPMIIIFNLLTPELYAGFSLKSTISAIVYGATGTIALGLIGKTFMAAIIIIFSSQNVLKTDFQQLYLYQYIFGQALVEFIYYLLPPLGTSAYFLTLL